MIQVTQLKKNYGQTVVLDISQLQIPQNQSFGLVGNNGAGKTTLFRCLLDLIKPTDGNVTINNIQVSKSEEWKLFTGSYLDEHFLLDFLSAE